MLFNKKFKVVEIRESSGIQIIHYLSGRAKNINKDIEKFKRESKSYEMMGKRGMVVWA